MSPVNLAEYLRVVSNDIFSLQQEIGCASSPLYETNMMDTWQSIVEEYQKKLELEKTSLIEQCNVIQNKIADKHRLLGETASQSLIEPPYLTKLAELNQELTEISRRTAEKEEQRSHVSQHIDELCTQLKIRKPPLPDLLTEAALAAYTELESQLEETRSNRLKLVHECDRNLLIWRTYLGKPHMTKGPMALDETAIEQLKKTCKDVQAAYESRFREIEAYENEISQLAEALQIPAELPSISDGCGTQSRIDALENRLHDLKLLRLEKLPELIEKARDNLAKIWDEVYYDHSLRKAYLDEPPTEGLLIKLNDQAKAIREEAQEPFRADIIGTIQNLESIFETEVKLQNLSNDPQKLAKGGFMAIIKEEGRLRMIVTKQKPETIAKLRRLLAAWHQEHPTESFYLAGEEINRKLQNDDLARIAHRSSTNLKRPRPQSSAAPPMAAKRAVPLSAKLMAAPTRNLVHPKRGDSSAHAKPAVRAYSRPHPTSAAGRMYTNTSAPVLPATQSTGILPLPATKLKRHPVVQSASQQARNAAISKQIRAAGSARNFPGTSTLPPYRRGDLGTTASGKQQSIAKPSMPQASTSTETNHNTQSPLAKETFIRPTERIMSREPALSSKSLVQNAPSLSQQPSAKPALAHRDPNKLAASKTRLNEAVKKSRSVLSTSHSVQSKRPHTSPSLFPAPVPSHTAQSLVPSKQYHNLDSAGASESLHLDDNHKLVPAHSDVENPVWNPVLTGNADVESSFFANESVIPHNSPHRLSLHRDCSAGF